MLRVLLADSREETVDADNWTVTADVGLKFVKVSEDGNGQTIVAEYHPRFWVRVSQPDVLFPEKSPETEDFGGAS